MEKYEKISKLGEGAHGVVFKYHLKDEYKSNKTLKNEIDLTLSDTEDEKQPNHFAIKKIRIRNSQYGLSLDALRELKFLRELNHPNILKCYDVFSHQQNLYIVLEYMSHDLEHIIKDRSSVPVLSTADVKAFMFQILSAIEYLHSNFIVHRDLKPSNCLISESNVLKLADFGLAKQTADYNMNMSPQACTLWYRAPELLFGSTSYSFPADIWSIGCIMGELLWRRPLFSGDKTELSQLSVIFSVTGAPSEENWPHANYLPNYTEFSQVNVKPLDQLFAFAGREAADLLHKMLQLDPQKRINVKEALKHPFFSTMPKMTPIEKLPRLKGK